MTLTYHEEVEQGSSEWHAMRCGLLTASQMNRIVTPTLKVAANDKSRAVEWEILAQRISGYVEPSYIGDHMLRGWEDEAYARDLYSEKYEPITETGFITNDKWGFTLGYSPDGLIGDKGLWENKSRLQRFQVETICAGEMPVDFALQVQTGLLVADDREWLDFTSYCGGMPMAKYRVLPDPVMQSAIINACEAFEEKLTQRMQTYNQNAAAFHMTERRVEAPILAAFGGT